jgi:hypothetical protein
VRLLGYGILLGWVLAGCPGCSRDAGVVRIEGGASQGFVLFSPLLSTTTYLIDRDGDVVHTWESELAPGASVYLLDNGHLLRCGRHPDVPFRGGGHGGRIQEFTWEGELVWDFVLASGERLQHHDIEPLPGGNVLAVVWEFKSREQAIRAGRDPGWLGPAGLWPDAVLEIQPLPPDAGRIVWEWHVWDHLIQDFDPERENYGRVSEHPELIDVHGDREPRTISGEELRRLQALGYVSDGVAPAELAADFLHTNSIAYNPGLDQIVLSAHRFNEIWILDHGTTTEEAAGHAGGPSGKGGDLLYRWGNPWAYRRGTAGDQRLFAHHDASWIPDDHPGAGNILVFNNGTGRPGGRFSSIVEIRPPVDADGRYSMGEGDRFGPDEPVWESILPDRFHADFISGAQRLPNGNTLVCSGPRGRFLEVTPNGEIVWEYRNPFSGDAPNPAGDPPYSVFRATFIPPDHPALAGRIAPAR